jgi:N-acetylglucosaminyldiphosphoundecaprenol N-acetyl-beta-D-mannosaminyltransferase
METQLFGYPVHLFSQSQALDWAEQVATNNQSCHVVTLNPEMIMQGEQAPAFGQVLKSADLALPDGAGLVWALRKHGHTVDRLPGIEFSEALLQRAAHDGRPIAIIGAAASVLEAAVANLKIKYPGLQIAYTQHGFFPAEEEASIAEACATVHPRIVLVALGVPRQELWIARYRALFPGAILVGIGGSLDVWSGTIRRAPALFRAMNLEWFYRIASQPFGKQGRLKRTYKTLPMFVVKVLLSKISPSAV